jgi:pyridoxal phosphate enzyme (YggS family)
MQNTVENMSKALKDNFEAVQEQIKCAEEEAGREEGAAQLIAVSKTYDAISIEPVIEAGQRIFGENRVQEAQGKWPELREKYSNIELHLIGPLQSNKSADAVALFDVIHTVDREKIAKTLSQEMEKQGRHLPCFVQVNTGEELQKAGIAPSDAVVFVKKCQTEYGLNIVGLMCIPPVDENPGPHFALLRDLAKQLELEQLSQGMSGDYKTAILMGATHVRVGSAIFGARD